MSTSVLVGYATRYGSTQEVAEAVAETLGECGFAVDIQPLREVRTLAGYQAIVLGAPLFMFHWHKEALSFLSRHRAALWNDQWQSSPSARCMIPMMSRSGRIRALSSIKSWLSSRGSNRSTCRCLAASMTQPGWASRSRCSRVRSRQVTCGTGRRYAPGQAAWSPCLSQQRQYRATLRRSSYLTLEQYRVNLFSGKILFYRLYHPNARPDPILLQTKLHRPRLPHNLVVRVAAGGLAQP